jgi:hypothetical protein
VHPLRRTRLTMSLAQSKQMHSYQHIPTLSRKQREASKAWRICVLRPQPPAYSRASVSQISRVTCRCGHGFGLLYRIQAGHSRPELRMLRWPSLTHSYFLSRAFRDSDGDDLSPVCARSLHIKLVVGNISYAQTGHRVRGLHGITCSSAHDHRLL